MQPSPPPPPPLYGLDIETDTVVDGLDPRVAAVVGVALVGPGVDLVLDGPEPAILAALDRAIAALPPGVLVTWNGAAFDLPFLADRAAAHGIRLGLRLWQDVSGPPRSRPLPGHPGPYRAAWYGHAHLDGYRLYRADVGAALGLPCGLKPMARLVGLPVVEVARDRIHHLDRAELHAYVASDALLARELVARRWATARLAVDRVGAPVRLTDRSVARAQRNGT